MIKLNFSGVGGRFDPNNNFIINALRKFDDVTLSDHPDFLIYSDHSPDYLNYDCVRIFYTAENLVPDFNLCDYGIGFADLSFGDRYIRYPLYLVDDFNAYAGDDYANDLTRAMHKHEYAEEKLQQKTDFCSFVYSNGEAVACREALFHALSAYKKVNSGGRYLNNVGGPVESKLDFQLKHKFVIAFENTSTPGYTTEKIVHAFSADAIPIYWGNPNIYREFRKGSFINCHDFGLTGDGEPDAINRIVKEVMRLDCDDDAYLAVLSTPAFADGYDIGAKKAEFENFLKCIFAQDKEIAYRRNRFYRGARYEFERKIGNAFYQQCRKLIPLRDALRKMRGKK